MAGPGEQQDTARARDSSRPSLKRKRGQETKTSSTSDRESRFSEQNTTEKQQSQPVAEESTHNGGPVENWILNDRWPKEYFESNQITREEILELGKSTEEQMAPPPAPVIQYVEINGFNYPRPIPKTPSLRRKPSDPSISGSNTDQNNREAKSTPYRDPRYPTLLGTKGSYMEESALGISERSKETCKALLSLEQPVPTGCLFDDQVFEATCRSVHDRNEARVIRTITPYIVPSAEDLAIMGSVKLRCLIENVNEGWINSIPIEGPRPQPDYSVGFKTSAFTDEQLAKLRPLVGSVFDTSTFVATFRMYFPFLTCEVKCESSTIATADRQNAHSMTIAVRGVVELYRAVGREHELNQEILAFSISHDNTMVKLYGHYPVIQGKTVTYYRHPIKKFDFTNEEGKEKWTAYKFTKNIYEVWMPTHLERICSVIDQLPLGIDFELSQASDQAPSETTGLSQDVGRLLSEHSNAGDAELQAVQIDDGLPEDALQTATPDTSVSRGDQQGANKRAKTGS